MVAIGSKQSYNNVFSCFIYTEDKTFSNNMNATNSLYNLYITAVYIKNNHTLQALFYDESDRIILGTVDMANFTFSIKQTLPNKPGNLIRAIFLDENKYMYGI